MLPDNTDIWPHDSGRDELEDSRDRRCVYSICACTSGGGPVLIAKSISLLWVFASIGDEGLEDLRPKLCCSSLLIRWLDYMIIEFCREAQGSHEPASSIVTFIAVMLFCNFCTSCTTWQLPITIRWNPGLQTRRCSSFVWGNWLAAYLKATCWYLLDVRLIFPLGEKSFISVIDQRLSLSVRILWSKVATVLYFYKHSHQPKVLKKECFLYLFLQFLQSQWEREIKIMTFCRLSIELTIFIF